MKTLALLLTAATLTMTSAAHATVTYTDTDGVVWTIEGPEVGRWRPFAGAAQSCPSHHVRADKVKLWTGNPQLTAAEKARDKSAGAETMHIVCIREPAVAPPSGPPREPRRHTEPNFVPDPNRLIPVGEERL
jgi:hypothetical protein